MTEATIETRGNGLCDVGDYVSGDDGEVYRVVGFVGPIQAGRNGRGDWICARVELADWTDVDDDSEPCCGATIDTGVSPSKDGVVRVGR